MKDSIKKAIFEAGFDIVFNKEQQPRPASYVSYDDMSISTHSKKFIQDYGISKLWKHQRKAIETALSYKNICISTSTGSGKTEIFQITAIEILEKNPCAKVLAIYSAKALNRQQKERWEKTKYKIGQIDGSDTNINNRLEILKTSNIVVMTPDVMHAFLLGKLSKNDCNETISNFIKNIELVIVDEIHLYRGVFGTNSAYLFRRFNNIRRVLRKDISYPLYITASATLPNPGKHSENITGVSPFINIGKEDDGSPISRTHFIFIQQSETNEISTNQAHASIAKLALLLSHYKNTKSITFVESRQSTGEVVLAMSNDEFKLLEQNQIYPYRAGMEESTREEILNRMQNGDFKGIVSTSALEIGIDIDGLNIAIIENIPHDRNSYYQRIGRVGRGRCSESFIIIVNNGSFKAQLLFSEYHFDIDKLLPDLEPSLYLDSKEVQYVHASCHSDFDKDNCELRACGCDSFDDISRTYFPGSFSNICQNIATRQTTKDYDKYSDIEDPHHYYSLRNNNVNYNFIRQDGTEIAGENVSRQQMLKEAYKGAIRNITHHSNGGITTHNQEVIKIDKVTRTITVKDFYEKNTKSKPISRTLVYPNFSKDRRFKTASCGNAVFYNLELYENITIKGYKRIVFSKITETKYTHPFIDTLRTTGVIMFHPALQNTYVRRDNIAKLIFEAFLMQNAFDRNDINHKSGKLYTPNKAENLKEDDRFIALYDINQLNITSNLLKENILKNIFRSLSEHLDSFSRSIFIQDINKETKGAIEQICADILSHDLITENCATTNGFIDIYSQKSSALYCPNDDFDDDTNVLKWQPCTILAAEKSEDPNKVVYVILTSSGQALIKIPEEQLKPTEDSRFSKYDWEKGIIIK